MSFSVVIPAHNEENVIARCLTAVLEGIESGGAEIVVVCNGCEDRTADIARKFGPAVSVVEIPVASKAAALNAGDRAVEGFPRFYVDADVEVSGAALAHVADELASVDGPLVAAPRLEVDLRSCSWPIRCYYRIWTGSPYVTDGLIGSGVYGLSAVGRARFAEFPTVIADDRFVYLHFARDERRSVEGATFVVHPPRNLASLSRVLSRRRAGISEVDSSFPSLAQSSPTEASTAAYLRRLGRDPRWWPALGIYTSVAGLGRLRGLWKSRFGDMKVWEREESSRAA